MGGSGSQPAGDAANSAGGQVNQKPSMLQALTSGPPGLKPAGNQQQVNANGSNTNRKQAQNQNQEGKTSDGKQGSEGGSNSQNVLQFGTITPNFLPMTGGQQPPAPPSAMAGEGSTKESSAKEAPSNPKQQQQGQNQEGSGSSQASPGMPQGGGQFQGQKQVPAIVTPPHHHGGYPMNAAFLAAAQAQAAQQASRQVDGVQNAFPSGPIPPQFRSAQGIHPFHMQQMAGAAAPHHHPGRLH